MCKKRRGVAVCQFILNCSPWFPVFLCPFMLSIVSKMVNVSTFMSTTLNQTDPKRTFATLLATCMSGGNVPEREVRGQVTYRCHLSCRAQGFPWNGGKGNKMETPLLWVTNVHLLISKLLFFGSAVSAASRPWRSRPFVLGVCSAEELLQLLFHAHLRHHLLLLSFSSAVHHRAP